MSKNDTEQAVSKSINNKLWVELGIGSTSAKTGRTYPAGCRIINGKDSTTLSYTEMGLVIDFIEENGEFFDRMSKAEREELKVPKPRRGG